MTYHALGNILHILPQAIFRTLPQALFALTIVTLVLRRRWVFGLAIALASPVLALPFARMPATTKLLSVSLPGALALAFTAAALLAMALAWASGQRRRREEGASAVLDRASMKTAADFAVARAARTQEPLALLLVEVDQFDDLKAAKGAAAGGRILQALGGVLQTVSNAENMVGQLRTREFAVLLPGHSFDEASETALRLHDAVESLRLREGNRPLPITVSIGVGMLRAGEKNWGPMLCRADVALFCARDSGPNRVALDTGKGRRQSDFPPLVARAA